MHAGDGVDSPTRTLVKGIEQARTELINRGAQVEPVEDNGGVLYARFADPDGNTWTLQHMPWRSIMGQQASRKATSPERLRDLNEGEGWRGQH
jgi:hypothetical protein